MTIRQRIAYMGVGAAIAVTSMGLGALATTESVAAPDEGQALLTQSLTITDSAGVVRLQFDAKDGNARIRLFDRHGTPQREITAEGDTWHGPGRTPLTPQRRLLQQWRDRPYGYFTAPIWPCASPPAP